MSVHYSRWIMEKRTRQKSKKEELDQTVHVHPETSRYRLCQESVPFLIYPHLPKDETPFFFSCELNRRNFSLSLSLCLSLPPSFYPSPLFFGLGNFRGAGALAHAFGNVKRNSLVEFDKGSVCCVPKSFADESPRKIRRNDLLKIFSAETGT